MKIFGRMPKSSRPDQEILLINKKISDIVRDFEKACRAENFSASPCNVLVSVNAFYIPQGMKQQRWGLRRRFINTM